MPKLMGSPRFVLVVYTDKELVGVTASESNSREEFRRLKSKAKDFVVKSSGMTLARVYLVQEPEQLSQATLVTEFQVNEWLTAEKKKLTKKEQKLKQQPNEDSKPPDGG